VTPLQGSAPHALFYDLTHDNESPLHKHSATGSVKGFDEIYPKLLNIVSDNRKYELSATGGISKVKRLLNHLHTEMALEGYDEGHVHQENDVSTSS